MIQPPLHTIALIVAAGSGERLGGEMPKAYQALAGKPILTRSIEAFLHHPHIDGVRVVINRAHHMRYKKVTRDLTLFPPVIGGATRADSVRLGLASIAHRSPAYVLIHDAARPLVSAKTIDAVLDELQHVQAAYPAVAVTDTIREEQPDGRMRLLGRQQLLAAQTPQGFDFNAIFTLHRHYAGESFTDDIALAQIGELSIAHVQGETSNIKITYPADLHIAEALLELS